MQAISMASHLERMDGANTQIDEECEAWLENKRGECTLMDNNI